MPLYNIEITYSAIVTMLADKTRRREMILKIRRMFRAMKIGPEGREGRKGLRSG